MTTKHEEVFDDECGWCLHPIKVYVRSWETCKSHLSVPILANYCDEKTCKSEDCEQNCGEIALSTPENEEKVLHEMWRRRKKLARLAAEAETSAQAEPVTNES